MSVLIVDDTLCNLVILKALLRPSAAHEIRMERNPIAALAVVRAHDLDLIVVDYVMPEMSGVDFVTQVRRSERHGETPIIMVTKADEREVRMSAFAAGTTEFIAKPIDPQELKARAGNLLKLAYAQRHAEALEAEVARATGTIAAREAEIIFLLSLAAEYRDPETGAHIARMTAMTGAIARELGLPEETCRDIYLAAPMHDVGKIAVPADILLKQGTYTAEERAAMAEHVRYGSEILQGSTSDLIRLGADIALTHHERWDGTGYPAGLAGEEIPLCGRIAAVADVYDALTSSRPYKAAWSRERAVEHMAAEAGKQFDPRCIAALLRVVAAQDKAAA